MAVDIDYPMVPGAGLEFQETYFTDKTGPFAAAGNHRFGIEAFKLRIFCPWIKSEINVIVEQSIEKVIIGIPEPHPGPQLAVDGFNLPDIKSVIGINIGQEEFLPLTAAIPAEFIFKAHPYTPV
jgi:hypothetical protein